MLKTTALKYYKSARAIAEALHISPVAVYRWGRVVPYYSARELEELTRSKLKLRRELYSRGRPLKGKELNSVLALSDCSASNAVRKASATGGAAVSR